MPQPIILPKEYQATVTHKQELYPQVFFLKLATPAPLPFIPGQYGSFLIDNQRRPFSFANKAGETTNDFLIVTKPQGLTETYLKTLKAGDSIKLLAPYGRFTLDATDTRPLLFIAAGTGIAPMRSHLQHLFSTNFQQPIILYFAHYDEPRLFFREEFEQLAKQHANFTYIPVLSEPTTEWAGKKGLVTTVVPEDIPNLSDYTIYVCGSPGMVTATVEMLKNKQVPAEQIHFERFT